MGSDFFFKYVKPERKYETELFGYNYMENYTRKTSDNYDVKQTHSYWSTHSLQGNK